MEGFVPLQAEPTPHQNGVVEMDILSELVGEKTLPRVDVERGVFITSRNEEIELSDKPISALIVQRLTQEGKPKIPMVKVTLLGRHEQLEANPNHPGYVAQLAEWETEVSIRILKYLFTIGVKGKPPQSFIDDHLSFFPDASDLDLKYLWVSSLVPEEDIDAITEAIMGRTLPTNKGVAEAAKSFRGNG